MNWGDAITSGAVAVCSSGVVVALITAITGRGGRRADEAKALTDIGRGFLSESQKDNKALRQELRGLRSALLILTDLLYETLPVLKGLTDAQRHTLYAACRTAQRAVFDLKEE
jgi:hypothetical protein